MKLHIFSLERATAHVPREKTYLIQIATGLPTLDRYLDDVQHNNYASHRYAFADRTPDWGEGILFTPQLATRIIQDFKQDRTGCGALLVHCWYGRNRAPSIAIALNELFKLGHDTEKLKRRHNQHNGYVYDVMLQVGRALSARTAQHNPG